MFKKTSGGSKEFNSTLQKLKNHELTELKLTHCKLHKQPYLELFNVLLDDRKVTSVDISQNAIGDDGAKAFARVIRGNPTITSVDLRNNSITTLGASFLVEAMQDGNLTIITLLLDEALETGKATDATFARMYNLTEEKKKLALICETNRQFVRAKNDPNSVELRMCRRGLRGLPEALLALKHLARLDLSGNQFVTVNTAFCTLVNLEVLFLNHNKITSLPMEFGNLVKLRRLSLSYNALTSVPECFGLLKSLESLDLDHNEIVELPLLLGSIKPLRSLKVNGNPLNSKANPIPREVLKGGNEAILGYLKNAATSGTSFFDTIKLMFVGNGNVGKTSLVKCFTLGKKVLKKEMQQPNVATDGVEINEKDFTKRPKKGDAAAAGTATTPGQPNGQQASDVTEAGKRLVFKTWDFAGQDVYYTTHQFFLTPHAIYLVIFNLKEDPETNRILYWMNSIKSHAKRAPVALIGTHADQCSPEEIDNYFNSLAERLLPFQENIKLQAVVSTTSYAGVKELKAELRKLAYGLEWYHAAIPRNYMALQSKIETVKKTRATPVISIADFRALAADCAIPLSDFKHAADFLTNLGDIIWFAGKRSKLSETVVLDSQWLARTFATIVSMKQNFAKDGMLRAELLKHLWITAADKVAESAGNLSLSARNAGVVMGTDTDLSQFLINLFSQFELLHPMGDGNILVPSLLPSARPIEPLLDATLAEIRNGRKSHLVRVFVLDFVPSGFFTKLMIRLLQMGWLPIVHYRNGFVVHKNGAAFSLDCDNGKARYFITVQMMSLRPHLSFGELLLFTEAVMDILSDWMSGFAVEVLVPCPLCLKAALGPATTNPLSSSTFEVIQRVHTFEWQQIEEAVRAGKSSLPCLQLGASGAPKQVTLDNLAPDLSMSDIPHLEFDELADRKQIGKGSFAEVYMARYNQKTVAVKKIVVEAPKTNPSAPPASGNSITSSLMSFDTLSSKTRNVRVIQRRDQSSLFAELRREATLMCQLAHPNVVGIVGITMNPLSIVMEFMTLGPLDSYVYNKDRKLSMHLRLKLCHDITSALKFMHTFDPPIVHRDLKTPNVLVVDGVVNGEARPIAKVGDLGLAQSLGAMAELRVRVVDNPRWLAPEILQSGTYSASADVYAFGIIAWEVWFQAMAYSDFSWWHSMEVAVLEGKRPATSPLVCPPDFISIMSASWATNPEARPTFTQLDQQMQRLVDQHHNTVDWVPSPELVAEVREKERIEKEKRDAAERERRRQEEEAAAKIAAMTATSSPRGGLAGSQSMSNVTSLQLDGKGRKSPSREEKLSARRSPGRTNSDVSSPGRAHSQSTPALMGVSKEKDPPTLVSATTRTSLTPPSSAPTPLRSPLSKSTSAKLSGGIISREEKKREEDRRKEEKRKKEEEEKQRKEEEKQRKEEEKRKEQEEKKRKEEEEKKRKEEEKKNKKK